VGTVVRIEMSDLHQCASGTEQSGGVSPAVPPSRYLTIVELAALTTLSVSTIDRLVKDGRLVAHQPGGKRHRKLFSPDAIEQLSRTSPVVTASDPTPINPPVKPSQPLRGPRPDWTKPKP
jgi:excisionase family DNA binding protein